LLEWKLVFVKVIPEIFFQEFFCLEEGQQNPLNFLDVLFKVLLKSAVENRKHIAAGWQV
jgi:hypothetical protein